MRHVVIALLVVFAFAVAADARVITLERSPQPTGVRLVGDNLRAKTGPALSFAAHVGQLEATEVKTPRGTFTQLSIPGFQHTADIGAPALPVMNTLIEVPLGATVEARIVCGDPKVYTFADLGLTAPLAPRQPPQPKDGRKVPFAYEKSTYVTPGFRADDTVSIEVVGTLRDVRLALLTVAPVAYDPVERKLEVRTDLQVEVTLKGADLEASAALKARYHSRAFSFARRAVLSPASLLELEAKVQDRPASYLIVADRMFENDLKPFVAWKVAKGLRVVTAYTDQVGTTPEAIQAYVHGCYTNATAEAPAPDFLLFVGDFEQVPAFDGQTDSHVTELPYVCVTPGDNLPDILTGRFSAKTSAELLPQLEKTLQYEKYQFADPSFLTQSVLIAGWDSSHAKEWGWPQINYATANYFNADHGYTKVSVFLSAGYSQNEPQIVAAVSAGCNFVNYTAHGSPDSWADPEFTMDNIDNLKNEGKYPLVIGNCCLTSKFEEDTCFAEAWLRAPKKGAIGYIGGTNSTYWDEDLWFGNGYYPIVHPNPQGLAPDKNQTGIGGYDAAFEAAATNAGMMVAGNLAVEASNTSRKLYYWEVYHLMGDPGLQTWFKVPQDATVLHPTSLKPGAGALEVKAPAGALVAFSVDGVLQASTFAVDGKATLAVNVPAAGQGTLVVTGDGLKPYQATIAIAQ